MTEVERAFAEDTRVQKMLDVEAALARAEARPGSFRNLPPSDLARFPCRALRRHDHRSRRPARRERRHSARQGAHPAPSRTTSAESSRYVHWGATSQDIIDTGLVLQLRDAVPIVVRDLRPSCVRRRDARPPARPDTHARTHLAAAGDAHHIRPEGSWLAGRARSHDGAASSRR